jgi:hypothetical protein
MTSVGLHGAIIGCRLRRLKPWLETLCSPPVDVDVEPRHAFVGEVDRFRINERHDDAPCAIDAAMVAAALGAPEPVSLGLRERRFLVPLFERPRRALGLGSARAGVAEARGGFAGMLAAPPILNVISVRLLGQPLSGPGAPRTTSKVKERT